jgi:large subunit ribosomal protein L33
VTEVVENRRCSAGRKWSVGRVLTSAGFYEFILPRSLITPLGERVYARIRIVFYFLELGRAMRDNITLACGECDRRNYTTTRNKKKQQAKLELKKFCRFCRKHTPHKETK